MKKTITESQLRSIIAESINKVLKEAEIMPNKYVDGLYDINKVTNPDFSFGDEYETGRSARPFAHSISYKGQRIGRKEQGGRNFGREYYFCAPDIEYGNQNGWGNMKWFDRADDYENYIEQNWDKIKELLDSGARFD